MKKLLWIGLALAMVFTSASAMAADLTGTWAGSMASPDGNSFSLTYHFTQDGAKLTGTIEGPGGEPMSIANGKIDGGKFSFDISFNGMTLHHEGTVEGDEIKLTSKSDGGDFPPMSMTLKRVPSKPAAPAFTGANFVDLTGTFTSATLQPALRGEQ